MLNKLVSTRFKGAYYIIILILFLLCLGVWSSIKSWAVLQVTDYFTQEVLYSKPIKVGDIFTLRYVHSVTKQPVYEVFKVKDKHTIAMVEMRYDSFGPNLPVGPETTPDETTEFIVEDGFYKIIYGKREFKRIPLRVGQVIANHTLIFSDQVIIPLGDVTDGGKLVEIYVQPRW